MRNYKNLRQAEAGVREREAEAAEVGRGQAVSIL